MFVKYPHVEKLGHPDVATILEGTVSVYPKLDGTNASIWLDEIGDLQAGSRNRQLTLKNDNAGFLAWVREHEERYGGFLQEHPGLRLYGEWLVPHTLKSYREDAWRRFWVFDVEIRESGNIVSTEGFRADFDLFEIDYIDPLAVITNPTEEQLLGLMNQTNTFLIEDGAGVGEGVVIKRYGAWRNRGGGQKWAKMVREANKKTFGVRETSGAKQIEAAIVEEFITLTLVQKELAKIVHDIAGTPPSHSSSEMLKFYQGVMLSNRSTVIPRLLNTVFHCLISEEMWAILKKHKRPTIDFGKLWRLTTIRTKELIPGLF